MPPEQANGDVALLDRRADVFGLGAILCEILTGKPPYVGRSYEEVRRKACNGDLADATARLDACAADAELIVLTRTCLAAEAIDRPRDAQAVADGLTAYLNGVQERLHQAELAHAAEVARTKEAEATAAQERKARRLTLALAVTVVLALTLGGGGWLWVKAERDARQIALIRDVNEALNAATTFRAQKQLDRALEQAQRALALVESGPTDAALKDQVTRLKAELDAENERQEDVAADGLEQGAGWAACRALIRAATDGAKPVAPRRLAGTAGRRGRVAVFSVGPVPQRSGASQLLQPSCPLTSTVPPDRACCW
jgi:serine/threonine-protein kinase